MQVHLLITLDPSIVLLESTSSSLDLYSASCLLLDVLDVGASGANHLRAEVESRDRFEVDRNALLRPLATTEVVALNLRLGFAWATESAFVNQVGKLLLHHLFDLLNGEFEAFLRRAGDVKIERRVLDRMSAC